MFDTKVPLYGIFIVISFVMGLIVIYFNIKDSKFRKEEILGLLFYILIGSIFGAKYFTFFINYKKYDGVFDFYKVGLSSYGAVIGIILMLYLFSKQFKKKFMDLINYILPSVPLMYAIGKIGCFFAGCCHGIKYNGVFSVIYNYSYDDLKGISLFPVQLLETIVFVIIFVYVFKMSRKEKTNIISHTLILCGVAKFLLDFLRMSHVGKILSINQVVSLLFIIIGIILLIKINICKKIKKHI